jgi:hypothetical protein
MLNSPTHKTSKLLAATPYFVLVIFISSCSAPNFETLNKMEQQAFIEITDSTIKSSVVTTTEIPLESALETTIEPSLESTDKTFSESYTESFIVSSCIPGETDCHHFDYSTPTAFLDSVVNYAYKNSMEIPIDILSSLTINAFIQVESLQQAKGIIELNPEHILILGQRIIKKDMPYEWLFAAELAFLRSWSNLSR